MRIIEPHQFGVYKKQKRARKVFWRTGLIFMAGLIIATIGLGVWAYKLPIPKISAKIATVSSPGSEVKLPWFKYGQSSIGAEGYGLLSSSPNQKAAPTASVAKIMTALAILKVKPLSLGEQGPTIILSKSDEQIFADYIAKDGSVVAVKAGERITEYQALQAILLPSANNMADTMVIWAFGSMQKYSDYANKLAQQLGMANTTITSASGFPPQTVSTADDLVRLGIVALDNPVIAQIVSTKTATIPVAGKIYNRNGNLGYHGTIGLKTGNTNEAGGCFVFAAKHKFANGQTVTLVGATLGAPSLDRAMLDSFKLIDASFRNFENRTIVKQGDKLGYYDLPWGGQVTAVAAGDVRLWGWKGSNLTASVNLEDIAVTSKAGSVVGNVQTKGQSSNLLLSSDITQPSRDWRLKRWVQ